jgi:hypothetical protein
VFQRLSPEDPAGSGLTGVGDRSDWCWSAAARVGFSAAFSGRLQWLLVPRTSSTLVAAWSWPTWVDESEICFGSRVRLVGVSISFKKNFYRVPFAPPSLVARSVLQYTHTIGSVDNWEELRDEFCHSFSPFGHSELLPCEFREFGQLEGESISVAWARFSHLLEFSSDLSVPVDVSLCTYYMRLDMEST